MEAAQDRKASMGMEVKILSMEEAQDKEDGMERGVKMVSSQEIQLTLADQAQVLAKIPSLCLMLLLYRRLEVMELLEEDGLDAEAGRVKGEDQGTLSMFHLGGGGRTTCSVSPVFRVLL